MATAANPYRAPAAAVADNVTEEYGEVSLFSASGRIGRARYIAYGMGVYIAVMAVIVVGALLGTLGFVVMAVGYIAMLVMMFMLTIQRCHDFNTTGWLSLLVLVPLANLLFLIVPGTDGENRFGLKTPP